MMEPELEYPRPWKAEEETGGRCIVDANGRWVFAVQYDEAARSEAEVSALVDYIVQRVNSETDSERRETEILAASAPGE
jgi:hypothetical protein